MSASLIGGGGELNVYSPEDADEGPPVARTGPSSGRKSAALLTFEGGSWAKQLIAVVEVRPAGAKRSCGHNGGVVSETPIGIFSFPPLAANRHPSQALQNDYTAYSQEAVVSVSVLSSGDPFYDGLRFSFAVSIRPIMLAPAASEPVVDPSVPLKVSSSR